MGLMSFQEETGEFVSSLFSLPCEDTTSRSLFVSQKECHQQTSDLCHLDLGLPSFQTVRNKYLLFKQHLWSTAMPP